METGEKGKEDINSLGDISSLDIKVDEKGDVILDEQDGNGDLGDPSELLRKSIEESYTPQAPKSEVKKEKEKEKELTIDDEEFVPMDEDDLDKLVRDPKAFNAMLNKLNKKAVAKGFELAMQEFTNSVPAYVKEHVSQQLTIRNAVSEFYGRNEDLLPYKNTVGAIAAKIASGNPDMSLSKVLQNAEAFARKRLNLPKKKEDGKGTDKGSPRFPKKPSGQRGNTTDNLTGLDKELDEMMKVS